MKSRGDQVKGEKGGEGRERRGEGDGSAGRRRPPGGRRAQRPPSPEVQGRLRGGHARQREVWEQQPPVSILILGCSSSSSMQQLANFTKQQLNMTSWALACLLVVRSDPSVPSPPF